MHTLVSIRRPQVSAHCPSTSVPRALDTEEEHIALDPCLDEAHSSRQHVEARVAGAAARRRIALIPWLFTRTSLGTGPALSGHEVLMSLRSLPCSLLVASSLALSMSACASLDAADKGIEEDVPLDGKLDSFRAPTDHGRIGFDRAEVAELTSDAGFHAWTFTLEAEADIVIRTSLAMPGTGEVDTVAYLYREGTRGFGRALTSNDDRPGTLFSAISRHLEAGRYRVLVKGYARTTRGPFSLAVTCSGAGCGTPPVDACLLGATFSDLRTSTRPRVTFDQSLRVTDVPTLPESLRAQIVRAVQQSAHTDVTTVEEAFARVDGGVVQRFELYDDLGARTFTAIEYGAGDNSYGAVFAGRTTDIAARLQDGDLADCNVGMEICRLGTTFRAFAEADQLVSEGERVVTRPTDVSGVRAMQLLFAVREAYEEVTDVPSALAAVDGGEINELVRRDPETDALYVAYEFGAGDNSYGAIFAGDELTPVARVNDADLYDCRVLGAPIAAPEGEVCGGIVACGAMLRCEGFVEEIGGRCVTTVAVPGVDLPCSATRACSAGLYCSGISRGPEGICRPSWMRATFDGGAPNARIPDGAAAGQIHAINAFGLATVDTDVELDFAIAHARPADVRVVLVNPAGTEVVVVDGSRDRLTGTRIEGTRAVGFSGDESVNGTWQLRVIDTRRGSVGTLERWSLTLGSRWD